MFREELLRAQYGGRGSGGGGGGGGSSGAGIAPGPAPGGPGKLLPPLVAGNDDEAVRKCPAPALAPTRMGAACPTCMPHRDTHTMIITSFSRSEPSQSAHACCIRLVLTGEGVRLRLRGGSQAVGRGGAGRVGLQTDEALGVGDRGGGRECAQAPPLVPAFFFLNQATPEI